MGNTFGSGTLRINYNVGMSGSFYRDNGRLVYLETIHDNQQGGKVVSQVSSVCEELPQLYGGVAPPPISDTNPKGVGRQEGRLIRLERVCGVRGRLP